MHTAVLGRATCNYLRYGSVQKCLVSHALCSLAPLARSPLHFTRSTRRCQPTRRSGHSLSLVQTSKGPKMWVFGGCTAGDASNSIEPGTTNNLYSCDLGKKEIEWSIADATVSNVVQRRLLSRTLQPRRTGLDWSFSRTCCVRQHSVSNAFAPLTHPISLHLTTGKPTTGAVAPLGDGGGDEARNGDRHLWRLPRQHRAVQ